MLRLEGKKAIVTGAAKGMGRATAIRFAQEGAAVAVVDVDADGALETCHQIVKAGGAAIPIIADVADTDDVEQAIERVVLEFGGLNVLHNNAAIWHEKDGPSHELEEACWARVIAVNLTGVFHCCHHAIPHMLKGATGSIINTSSPVVTRSAVAGDAYAASKGGVLSLTRSIAQYYGRWGLRANVLMPSGIRTDMNQRAFENPRLYETFVASTPLGRVGDPEEAASAALYLASDESSFVTGTVHCVDGGWLIGPPSKKYADLES